MQSIAAIRQRCTEGGFGALHMLRKYSLSAWAHRCLSESYWGSTVICNQKTDNEILYNTWLGRFGTGMRGSAANSAAINVRVCVCSREPRVTNMLQTHGCCPDAPLSCHSGFCLAVPPHGQAFPSCAQPPRCILPCLVPRRSRGPAECCCPPPHVFLQPGSACDVSCLPSCIFSTGNHKVDSHRLQKMP